MKDPLEEQLRMLRPSPIPEKLRERLAVPPPLAVEHRKIARFPWWKPLSGLAAAACVLLAFAFRESPHPGTGTVFDHSHPGEIIAARTVGMVDDGGQRAWEVIEVERVAEQTLLAKADGLAVLTQDIRRELVPVEIHFD